MVERPDPTLIGGAVSLKPAQEIVLADLDARGSTELTRAQYESVSGVSHCQNNLRVRQSSATVSGTGTQYGSSSGTSSTQGVQSGQPGVGTQSSAGGQTGTTSAQSGSSATGGSSSGSSMTGGQERPRH